MPEGTQAFVVVDRALKGLYFVCAVLAAGAIALIACLVTVSIGSRLFGFYVPGLTEGAGYAMAAAGSLGLAYTFRTGGHIRVDLVLSWYNTTLRRRSDQLAVCLTAGTVCFLAWYLVRMVSISVEFGDLSDGSDELPLWLPQFPAAFGFTVFAVSLVHGAIEYLIAGRNPVVSDAPLLTETEHQD